MCEWSRGTSLPASGTSTDGACYTGTSSPTMSVAVRKSKFNLCFNLRCVVVGVRCFSLNTVAGIARRSCPSLSHTGHLRGE